MKVILTQEVSTLGAPGDVVEVKDGYGRNYLVPRGLAMRWTKGAEKQITSIKKARSVRDVRDLGHADQIKQSLEALSVTVPAQAGGTGRLFGSVTVSDIAAAVTSAGGPDIDKRRIEIKSVKGLEHARELKTAIEGLGAVELSVKSAGDSGKLFGSVTTSDVVAAIKKAGGPNLDKRTIKLPKAHIKTVGSHPITVQLHPEVNAAVSLNVVAG